MAGSKSTQALSIRQSAVSHGKKTNPKTKSSKTKPRKDKTLTDPLWRKGHVEFPEVKGKTVEEVSLYLNQDDTCVSLLFADRTLLAFDLEPRISVRTDFSDWKTHNWRGIKRWPPLLSKSSWQD